ncbi:hypothetical protein JB92DRAFT_2999247 [Gautieria morchelliformis]|nr:hypothetical protein JB92DRAFT_2999247 [Gautieria morchelliformis]
MSEKVAGARLQTQAAQGAVLAKLIAFAVALAVVPIGGYFVSLWYLFNGNTTYSAITAIVAANIVLVSYIIVSIMEDASSDKTAQVGKPLESRKSR